MPGSFLNYLLVAGISQIQTCDILISLTCMLYAYWKIVIYTHINSSQITSHRRPFPDENKTMVWGNIMLVILYSPTSSIASATRVLSALWSAVDRPHREVGCSHEGAMFTTFSKQWISNLSKRLLQGFLHYIDRGRPSKNILYSDSCSTFIFQPMVLPTVRARWSISRGHRFAARYFTPAIQ
jgi:hypothetical protein